MSENTAVIMITCQKFKQLWGPFFILLDKYWSDCYYKKYMITDFGGYDGVENIELKKDYGFSSNLIYAFDKIKENKIIYFQEDYLATGPFNNKRIKNYDNYMNDKNIGCLRLVPCPGPSQEYDEEKTLGILRKGDAYRVSTQTAIWKKETLLSILKHGESGQQFETLGTKRSEDLSEQFLSVFRGESPTPYYITAIVRGVWQEEAIELLKKENISIKDITKVIK